MKKGDVRRHSQFHFTLVCCAVWIASAGGSLSTESSRNPLKTSATPSFKTESSSDSPQLLKAVQVPEYQRCIGGYYGPRCGGSCNCGPNEDCDDGPTGFGTCTCRIGSVCTDGNGKRMQPPPLATPLSFVPTTAAAATLAALDVDPETARETRQVHVGHVSRINPMPFRFLPDIRLVIVDPY
eukprot:gene24130-22304_t